MTVVQQESADKYKVVENFPTQPGARTITLNKTTHHIYLPVAEYASNSGGGWPSAKPGTFGVLDIQQAK